MRKSSQSIILATSYDAIQRYQEHENQRKAYEANKRRNEEMQEQVNSLTNGFKRRDDDRWEEVR